MTDAPDDFPPLHEAVLGADELHALFRDIETLAEDLEVRVQGQAGRRVGEQRPQLTRALADLEQGSIAGVQIRYRYQGGTWWDTVQRLGEGYRLVRIRHDFGKT